MVLIYDGTGIRVVIIASHGLTIAEPSQVGLSSIVSDCGLVGAWFMQNALSCYPVL